MKGLREYIKKHGKHFTEELAMDACKCKWDSHCIMNTMDRKVYYNVTESSLGDIVYIVNSINSGNKHKGINKAIDIIGDFSFYDGVIFMDWVVRTMLNNSDFNLEKYI